jgi:hypothetical protein
MNEMKTVAELKAAYITARAAVAASFEAYAKADPDAKDAAWDAYTAAKEASWDAGLNYANAVTPKN